jgi:hypothetical protein
MTWEATGTDSSTNSSCAAAFTCLLTFQFTVTNPVGAVSELIQFNAGTLSSGVWTSPPFKWAPTGIEGTYNLQVVAKDWTTGETATKTTPFKVNPLVTGTEPVVAQSATNPLVYYFSAPSCASGSSMQVLFQQQSGSPAPVTTTNAIQCHPPYTMTFELAGMYPKTAYYAHSQTITGGTPTNGPILSYTTGALPTNVPFPPFTAVVPAQAGADTADAMILWNLVLFGVGTTYPDVATDLSGKIMWYYYTSASGHYNLLTRPLPNGLFMTIQNAGAWQNTSYQQVLREVDLAGNVILETNIGLVEQQLLALGDPNAHPCSSVPSPPAIGDACMDAFHHDAIQTLPNGETAALTSVEKIFAAGTQPDGNSDLPQDILGDIIIVLDSSWNVVWYFDSFQHDSGPPQLSITRPSILPNTCVAGQQGCPPIFLLGPGVAPVAQDWLHGNSLYYWPQTGNIIWSSKNQDWIMDINFDNAKGNADIFWRVGNQGDFMMNNCLPSCTAPDPWPWFSSQHDTGIENGGTGPWTSFDNGDTRVTVLGSTGCQPLDCDSRGMAYNVTDLTGGPPPATACSGTAYCGMVTPTYMVDLGVYSSAGGSAQLLSNGDFHFYPPVVFNSDQEYSYSIETLSTTTYGKPTEELNVQGTSGYRSWRMPNLYNPPTT